MFVLRPKITRIVIISNIVTYSIAFSTKKKRELKMKILLTISSRSSYIEPLFWLLCNLTNSVHSMCVCVCERKQGKNNRSYRIFTKPITLPMTTAIVASAIVASAIQCWWRFYFMLRHSRYGRYRKLMKNLNVFIQRNIIYRLNSILWTQKKKKWRWSSYLKRSGLIEYKLSLALYKLNWWPH